MKLINWRPNNDLFNIFDNIDQHFDHYFQRPNASIKDEGKAYSILLEMPGIDKKNINITINEGIINIQAEKKDDKTNFVYSEMGNCNYSRSFYLPDDINIDKIKAKSLNGVLNIDIPKLKTVNQNIKKIAIS